MLKGNHDATSVHSPGGRAPLFENDFTNNEGPAYKEESSETISLQRAARNIWLKAER
jgi:hypothetical protein